MAIVNVVVGCLCIITITVVFVFAKWMYEILNDADKPTEVKIKLIDGGKLPEFKTKGAVCADCYARLDTNFFIKKGERKLIPLGFACGLSEGYEIQVRPRSGLSSKGIDVSLGTGDWDYTGEYMACVTNNSEKDFPIHNGDRICQFAIREVPNIKFKLVDELEETERGSRGFGHTGI